MGTDRLDVYRGPCLCGKGEVTITFCTPDHPWPTQSKWFETSNSCEDCSKEYSLTKQVNHFVFVRKGDQRQSEDYWKEYSRRSGELLSWPDVNQLLHELESLLESKKSMTACHMLLSAHKLDYYSIGTFRKKWTGAKDWIRNNIRSSNIINVMDLLGSNNQGIEEELKALEVLYAKYKEPLPVIGALLIDVSRY